MGIRESAAKMKIRVFDFIVLLMDHIWKGVFSLIFEKYLVIIYNLVEFVMASDM